MSPANVLLVAIVPVITFGLLRLMVALDSYLWLRRHGWWLLRQPGWWRCL